MQVVDDKVLLEIVGSIYDCVIAPERWENTVALIQQTFRWHNAVLAANSLIGSGAQIQVIRGVPEQYMPIALDASYGQPVLDLWGGVAKVMQAPLEEPLVQSQMGDPETWPGNRYFTDFVAPQGIVDAVTIGLARDPTMVATLTGGRHGAQGPIEDEELNGLRVLAPHLRRAVTISNLFDDMRGSNAAFLSALETSRAGIVLVDDRMAIVHANAPAQHMLSAGDPVRESGGRLVLREELSPGALFAAVGAAHDGSQGRSSSGIPTRRRDGSPLLMHVLPLKGGKVRPGIVMRATAAIFIAPSPVPLHLPAEALSLLFDLTPAEVRVMELAADGLSKEDAALRLGIAQSTLKTHLLRVYEKTGTRRQSELAILARDISLPW